MVVTAPVIPRLLIIFISISRFFVYLFAISFDLVKTVKEIIKNKFNPDGFNVGVNSGETAGQTIFHAHIHVIPRYKGDVPNPRGGVRNVIPDKADY